MSNYGVDSLARLLAAVTEFHIAFNAWMETQVESVGTVALGDHRVCGIVGGAGSIQIASWSSSNTVANRYTDAMSTPSS